MFAGLWRVLNAVWLEWPVVTVMMGDIGEEITEIELEPLPGEMPAEIPGEMPAEPATEPVAG